MTAGELIKVLSQFNPDTRVIVDGYEDGYDDIASFGLARIRLQPSAYCGRYQPDQEGEVALLISRDVP